MVALGIDDITDAAQNLEAIRLKNLIGTAGMGGSDESYDAVDFQNYMLALVPPNPGDSADPADLALINRGPDDILGTADDRQVVIPSLHRPALINYWRQEVLNAGGALQNDPKLLRRLLLRPNWLDHPTFTGSNPTYANLTSSANPNLDRLRQMIYGPWDVDNDSDGIPDSIWVDFGAPVMENSDGRLVKPLAAVLVVDMDGRLNLNAHGSNEHLKWDLNGDTSTPEDDLPTPQTLANGLMSNRLPRGQGYGPAEISLAPLMPLDLSGSLSVVQQRRKWFMRFIGGVRRGDRIVPDANSNVDAQSLTPTARIDFLRSRTGKLGNDRGARIVPGQLGVDLAAQMKMQGVPLRASAGPDPANTFVRGEYVTPPDFKGRYALGLNDLGQPVYEAIPDAYSTSDNLLVKSLKSLLADSPYETNLSLGASRGESTDADDGPYTIAELERVLRAFDPDAGTLPSRLWEMAGMFKDNVNDTTPNLDKLNLWRQIATTDSYDLPMPSVVVPQWMVEQGTDTTTVVDNFAVFMGKPAVASSFAELLEYRLLVGFGFASRAAYLALPETDMQKIAFRREMRKLLPRDLADGLRLDINRPLGNGRDDNRPGEAGYGVVDEPGEFLTVEGVEAPFWASNETRLNAFTDEVFGKIRDDYDRNGDGVIENWERGDSNDDGVVDSSDDLVALHNYRRQMLARDLYVVAQTLADPLPVPTGGVTDPGYIEKRANRAKQLAQWAINVVDFRDPDNIMTAFEYDIDPFDGWSADGSMETLTDVYGTDNQVGGVQDPGGVVWGAESPELIMTETLAWHDRRTIDTQREGEPSLNEADSQEKADVGPRQKQAGQAFDLSQEQRERPQGVALVELYCPLTANPAANADTHLIDNAGNDLGINLAGLDQGTASSPVWRMMVYKKGGPDRRPEDPNVDNQPTDLKLKPLADRCVYFAGFDPATSNPRWDDAADGVAFFNEYDERTGTGDVATKVSSVRPGRYMVVGGGEEENPGTGVYLAKFGENNSQSSQRGIRLKTGNVPDAVALLDSNGILANDVAGFSISSPSEGGQLPSIPGDTRQSIADVAIINQTATNPTPNQPRLFNVSEPAAGYPRSVRVESEKGFSNSAWDETKKQYVPILDRPLDEQRLDVTGGGGINDPRRQLRGALFDGDTRLGLPADDRGDRTIPNFSWIYLQRLANPLIPWNPPARLEDGTPNPKHDSSFAVNPYLTVDSMGVNVTVFNGLSEREYAIQGGDHKSYSNNYSMQTFASLQRGRLNSATEAGSNDPEPYDDASAVQAQIELGRKRIPQRDTSTPPEAVANLYGTERIETKSYWKNEGGPSGNGNQGGTNHYFDALPDHTLGFLNEPFRGGSSSKVEPAEPFPWLTWNNRPYANAGELLQVPAFNGLDLLHTFSYSTTPTANLEHYGSTGTPSTDDIVDLLEDLKAKNPKLTNTLDVDGKFGH
ncbi:MAG: hypothetical protein ACR2NM_14745, partial [Bythopirellula sp.]